MTSASIFPSTRPLGLTVQCPDWMLPRNVPSILISPPAVIFPSNTVSAAMIVASALALGCKVLSLDGGFLRLKNIWKPGYPYLLPPAGSDSETFTGISEG